MALVLEDFKEVGGPGNSQDGGQVYSVQSDADTLGVMLASGYLNNLAFVLNVRDTVILSGTDGAVAALVSANSGGVVDLTTVLYLGAVQTLTGAGAVDIVSAVTELVTTGADALTIADGAIGQTKFVVMATDGGTGTLTPTTGSGYSTIAFADAGDSDTLLFGTTEWAIVGSGGLAGGPVAA